MKITLTGASGLIGGAYAARVLAAGGEVRVLGRKPWTRNGARFWNWDAERELPPAEALDGVDGVVHLAGEPVAQRWTPEVKRRLRSSRVEGTRAMVDAIGRLEPGRRPPVFVCASAVGYYGSRGSEVLVESASPGRGFLADLCVEWETAARGAEQFGVRVVMLRIGMVLARGSGALKTMLPPFRMGAGGKVGSGEQWMAWIHITDMAGLIEFAVAQPRVQGPVNAVAPNPVTNAELTKALGSVLHRPAIMPVPEFAVKMLFGEMASVVLASQRVLPQAALTNGYRFRFPELRGALEDVLR